MSGVWEAGIDGAGVTVAVVDDGESLFIHRLYVAMVTFLIGVEWQNPDLIDNYVSHSLSLSLLSF